MTNPNALPHPVYKMTVRFHWMFSAEDDCHGVENMCDDYSECFNRQGRNTCQCLRGYVKFKDQQCQCQWYPLFRGAIYNIKCLKMHDRVNNIV